MKKTTMFRRLSLVTAGVFFLAACGSGDDSTPDSTASTEDSGDEVDAGAIQGDLEIQYFIGGYGDDWWQAMFTEFREEYPDVNLITHGGPTIHDEMRNRWLTNDPPDIVHIEGAGISEAQLVSDDQLLDITDWITEIQLENGDNLVDRFIVPANVYDGTVYSVPLIYDNRGIWFDQAWFDENNWETPYDIEAWEESMAQIRDEADVPPIATTGVYPAVFLQGVLYPAFASAGGEELLNRLVQGDPEAWSSDEVRAIAERLENWVSEGFVDPGFASLTHTQAQVNFLMHRHAYVPTGFWLPNEMINDTPEDFEYAAIPTPFNDPGEKMTVVPEVKTIAVAKEAKNPEAAKAFIDFLYEEDHAKDFAILAGAMLNIGDVDLESDPEVPEYLKQANVLINDEERVQLSYLEHPMHADLLTPIGDALVALLLGDMSAEEFVAAATAAAESFSS